MFLLIIMLACAGTYVEMKAIASFPAFGRFVSKYRLASLAFSFGLSILLAIPFGAAGLMVFAAGLLSTVMIQPYYALMKSGRLDDIRTKRAEITKMYYQRKDSYLRRAQQTWAILFFVWKIMIIPFKVIFFFMDLTDRLFAKKEEEVKSVA